MDEGQNENGTQQLNARKEIIHRLYQQRQQQQRQQQKKKRNNNSKN